MLGEEANGKLLLLKPWVLVGLKVNIIQILSSASKILSHDSTTLITSIESIIAPFSKVVTHGSSTKNFLWHRGMLNLPRPGKPGALPLAFFILCRA